MTKERKWNGKQQIEKFTCCFIMLILVLSLYGCGVSSEQVKDAVANTVIKKCESYGLRNVSIAVSGGEKDDAGFQIFHMTVISSNFDSLSYEQMFAFEKELDKTIFGAVGTIGDRIIVTENYESNGDTWNVYESTIYKMVKEYMKDLQINTEQQQQNVL